MIRGKSIQMSEMQKVDFIEQLSRNVPPEESGYSGTELRNYIVCHLRICDKTLQEIGVTVGLTRERVRQIVNQIGETEIQKIIQIKKDKNELAQKQKLSVLIDFISTHKGLYIRQIPSDFANLISELPKSVSKFIATENIRTKQISSWTDRAIIEAISQASTYHFPLSRKDYDELVRVGEIDGPSAALVMKRFQTWSAACEQADVETYSTNINYEKFWNTKEMTEYLVRFMDAPGISSSIGSYADWQLRQHDKVPSAGTIREEFGSWADALATAHLSFRKSWEYAAS